MWHEITFLIYPLPLEDIYGTGNVIFCGMPMQYADDFIRVETHGNGGRSMLFLRHLKEKSSF